MDGRKRKRGGREGNEREVGSREGERKARKREREGAGPFFTTIVPVGSPRMRRASEGRWREVVGEGGEGLGLRVRKSLQ